MPSFDKFLNDEESMLEEIEPLVPESGIGYEQPHFYTDNDWDDQASFPELFHEEFALNNSWYADEANILTSNNIPSKSYETEPLLNIEIKSKDELEVLRKVLQTSLEKNQEIINKAEMQKSALKKNKQTNKTAYRRCRDYISNLKAEYNDTQKHLLLTQLKLVHISLLTGNMPYEQIVDAENILSTHDELLKQEELLNQMRQKLLCEEQLSDKLKQGQIEEGSEPLKSKNAISQQIYRLRKKIKILELEVDILRLKIKNHALRSEIQAAILQAEIVQPKVPQAIIAQPEVLQVQVLTQSHPCDEIKVHDRTKDDCPTTHQTLFKVHTTAMQMNAIPLTSNPNTVNKPKTVTKKYNHETSRKKRTHQWQTDMQSVIAKFNAPRNQTIDNILGGSSQNAMVLTQFNALQTSENSGVKIGNHQTDLSKKKKMK